jgi:hypothetical protein
LVLIIEIELKKCYRTANMLDVVYYVVSFVTVLGLPLMALAIIFALVSPSHFNTKFNKSYTRKRIAGIGVASLLIATIGFGTVLAATEPESVKQSIVAQQAWNAKAQQLKQEQEALQKADALKPVTKTVTSTENIPFQSIQQNSSTLASGKQQVSAHGVDGEHTITYQVTYVQGKETARKQVSDSVTKQPVTQITLIGTYVAPAPTPAPAPAQTAHDCPNGTYVNSAGNTVCSPYASSSAPTGATAKCGDGTYSFSQSCSGTCSHHGGVATWL